MPQSAAQRVRPGAEPFRFGAGSTGALLLHGFTGSPASLRPLGESLGAAGVTAVGPLLPGHGTSDWNDLGGATLESWREAADAGLAGLGAGDSPPVGARS